MKKRLLFLVSTFCLIPYSCNDSGSGSLKISQPSFNSIGCDGATLEIGVISSSNWTISKAAKWCNVTPTKGPDNQKLTLGIETDLGETTRNVTITVTPLSGGISQTIKITQNGITAFSNPETYHCKLPVTFHVPYRDKSNKNQYVRVERLSEILERVNKPYRNVGANSTDMNLESILATEDPKGKTLSRPSVEHIEWSTTAIDISDLMFNNNRAYNYLIWESSGYINITVHEFADVDMMGVSHFPYSPTENPLSGTETDSRPLAGDNLKYAYCTSISNSHIYEESTSTIPNQNDMAITLVHELKRHLGLYHILSESEEDGVDAYASTDYCIDTYTYDQKTCKTWVKALVEQSGPISLEGLARRHGCVQNIDFISRNIVDYVYGYLNKFITQQETRVRHIPTYSPLIPGLKKGSTSTHAVYDGPLDLPIRMMK